MTTRLRPLFAHCVLSLAVAALAAGCMATTSERPAPGAAAPAEASADVPAGLRCMDNLLLEYGARELPVGIDAGSAPALKEALGAAVSEMSRRSRVIRLVADASANAPQALRPEYTLRAAVGAGEVVELQLIATQDQTVVPGVAARNQAQASALQKFGRRFALPADAPGARRALAQVGAIEVVGRLAKLPYWTCLGGSDEDPDAAAELRDWYDAMVARPKEIIEYFQQQLRLRGVYEGPVDGVANSPFKEAVARYREALGQSREPKLSKEFFRAYLAANHRELLARVKPVAPAPVAPQAAPSPVALRGEPLGLRIASANDARQFERGEVIQLVVRPSRDAHVYCFLQDENRKVTRFFPNRFQRASRVEAASGLKLPGGMRFELRMNPKGITETVSCFATERDVLPALPALLTASDFAPLPVASLDQVRDAFQAAAGGAVARESFQFKAR